MFETPNSGMLLSPYRRETRARFPDVGTLVGWSLVLGPRLLLIWCYMSPSAPLEPGKIAPAEERCRNLPAGVQCCGRRPCIAEMFSPACWRAGQGGLWLGCKKQVNIWELLALRQCQGSNSYWKKEASQSPSHQQQTKDRAWIKGGRKEERKIVEYVI